MRSRFADSTRLDGSTRRPRHQTTPVEAGWSHRERNIRVLNGFCARQRFELPPAFETSSMVTDSVQTPSWIQILGKTLSLPSVLYPGGGHRGVIRRWKLVARSLIQWPWTVAWYRFLEAPRLQVTAAARPRLYTKLQRPYLTRRHGFGARLAALTTHYTWVDATLPETMLEAIYRDPGLELGRLPLEEGRSLVIRLCYTDRYEKEGDLSFCVSLAPTETLIYTVTFSVTQRSGMGRGLFIGGLQGGNAPDQPDIVRQLTREMFGMRPKAFALYLVQQAAEWIGAVEIRGVADEETVYRHLQNRKVIEASYDRLWSESGGTRSSVDHCFDLPPRHVEIPREEIKTSKRSLYQKRYALLRDLSASLRARWEASISEGTRATPDRTSPGGP